MSSSPRSEQSIPIFSIMFMSISLPSNSPPLFHPCSSSTSFLPLASPSPFHKTYSLETPSDDRNRDRAVSEPVQLDQFSLSPAPVHLNKTNGMDTSYTDQVYPKHTPMNTSYDSRTPRLVRGALKKSNIIYRKDLDDFNKQDITVVMFPRDATLERNPNSKGDTLTRRHSDINDENTPKGSLKKGGLTIVPSGTTVSTEVPVIAVETTDNPQPPPQISSSDETKSEGQAKPTRKLSKTFSFLSKKEKGDGSNKKKSPKTKRKKSSSVSEKSLSSGGLSGISMPNLYSPTSDESDTNENSTKSSKNYSFFRRKQDKKTNVQRTSWTFQQADTVSTPSLQPAMSLQNIAESPTDLGMDTDAQTTINRTGSMEELHVNQFTSELNAPVNVIRSHDDDDDMIPSSSDMNNRSPSPLSIDSISIDIPDLLDPNKPVTPVPTNNDIMNSVLGLKSPSDQPTQKPSNVSVETTSKNCHETEQKPSTNEQELLTPAAVADQKQEEDEEKRRSFSRNLGSRKPLRKPSVTGKDSPIVTAKKRSSTRQTPDSLDELSVSTSPSKISLNSSGSFGDSPITTPTNERKKLSKSPVFGKADKARNSFKNTKAKSINKDLTTPTNSPKVSHHPTSSIAKVKQSPGTSPVPPSPVASHTSKKTKSPIAARKFVRSTPATSSLKKTSTSGKLSPKSSPKSSPRNSPKTGRKVSALTLKSKSLVDTCSSQLPESPMTKKRRLGITSVTSPLTEEKHLGIFQLSPSGDKSSKIIPKRPAPSPPSYKRTASNSSISKGGSTSGVSGVEKDKIKPTTPLSQRKSTSAINSNNRGNAETYVYQSKLKKNSDSVSIVKSSKDPPQTYTYTGSSLKKKSQPAGPGVTQQNNKVTDLQHNSQRKSSIPSIKTTSSNGTKKSQNSSIDTETSKTTQLSVKGGPPKYQASKSSVALTTRTSSPSLRKQQKLSLVEMGNREKPTLAVKSNSEEQNTTLDILKPLGSLLSSSTDIMSKGLTPPPIGSMPARTFSPTSPPLSPDMDEGDISLTPEVPMDGEDRLTYVYRSTLLRKSSGGDKPTNPITRTSSNQSVGADSTRRMSRTGSPRKGSLAPTLSPSRRVSSGASIRRGSLGTLSPVRKSSATMSMRRPSSGVARTSTLERGGVRNSTSLVRPRSASQASMFQSLRKKSVAPVSTLTRQSLRNKKSSVDTLSKKPPSGLQTTKRSAPAFPSQTSKRSETTDGGFLSKTKSPTHSSSPSAEIKEVSYSKPKTIVKSNSAAGIENKPSQVRKSMKASKSFEPVHKPKLSETKSSVFSKPPSGSGTIGRSSTKKVSTDSVGRQSLKKAMSTDSMGRHSLKKTMSTDTLSRTSTRMSRRSNAGTIKKVSQSNSPLHSSTKASPTHGTLSRKKDSDTLDDFNYVSSMADKTK